MNECCGRIKLSIYLSFRALDIAPPLLSAAYERCTGGHSCVS